ncbi:hypothetical protein DPMN_169041 [Dreissena polymorpha]|uniref:Uncharacterized protein n=1 Tax=Dreissena polymorpha TaxID=45954 RepID=A0A9D4J072_DREPO|nr:hypothetical protein DPMN_169041 [Dreissena polymorpha]
MTNFLACFLVPDAVSNKSGKQLMNLDLVSSEIMLNDKDMFVGASNQKLICEITSKDINVKTFRKQKCLLLDVNLVYQCPS